MTWYYFMWCARLPLQCARMPLRGILAHVTPFCLPWRKYGRHQKTNYRAQYTPIALPLCKFLKKSLCKFFQETRVCGNRARMPHPTLHMSAERWWYWEWEPYIQLTYHEFKTLTKPLAYLLAKFWWFKLLKVYLLLKSFSLRDDKILILTLGF